VTHTLPPYYRLPTYDKSLDTHSRHELYIPPLGAVIKYLKHTRRLGPTPHHPTISFLHITTHKILIGVTNSVFHELCIPPLGAIVKFLEHISQHAQVKCGHRDTHTREESSVVAVVKGAVCSLWGVLAATLHHTATLHHKRCQCW